MPAAFQTHDVALLHTQGGGVTLQETTLHLEGLEVVGASSHLPLRDYPIGTVFAPRYNTEEGSVERLHLQVISLELFLARHDTLRWFTALAMPMQDKDKQTYPKTVSHMAWVIQVYAGG